MCLLDKSLLKPVIRDVKIIVREGVEKDVKKQRNLRKGREKGEREEAHRRILQTYLLTSAEVKTDREGDICYSLPDSFPSPPGKPFLSH